MLELLVKYRGVVVLGAFRTPIGRFGGAFKDLTPVQLASIVIREALSKLQLKGSDVELIVVGQVLRGGAGQLTAKQIAMTAGLPSNIQAVNVDHVCSSAMEAVHLAAIHISYGVVKLAIAGGVESMSYAPLLLPSGVRWGVKHLTHRKLEVLDSMILDGLTDPFSNLHMGVIADEYAKKIGATREELDVVAYESHVRAIKATDEGYFKNEIVPVKTSIGEVLVDEGIRRDVSLEKLANLPPVFTTNGLHTAGNSSQLSDGAAFLVLAEEEWAKGLGFKPLARLLGYSSVDGDPREFIGMPPKAVVELLKGFSISLKDIDLFENNEAFAVSTIAFEKALGVSRDKLNIFGGAIALGHPIGATGARILVTLINALKTLGKKIGIASLCHGSGGATASLIEVT